MTITDSSLFCVPSLFDIHDVMVAGSTPVFEWLVLFTLVSFDISGSSRNWT